MKSEAFLDLRWMGVVTVAAGWGVSSHLITSDALPAPLEVLQAALRLVLDGTLVWHTWVSLRRVLIGFALGLSTGVITGLCVSLSHLARRTIYFLIEILRPVPGIAWLPLAVLWFGLGEGSKYFLIAVGVFFPVFVGTLRGVLQTDPIHVRSAQALGASHLQVIRDVVLPSALPEILTAQRIGLSLGFIYMVAAELIGAQSGLGFLITYSRAVGLPAQIYVGILLIGCLNLGFGAVQKALERRALQWHFSSESENRR